MLKKIILINVLISIIIFSYIFYYYSGISGGDLAICSINIFFGIFQILIACILSKKILGKINSKVVMAIILMQVVELMVFINWGYSINEVIKSYKFN